MKQAIVLLIFFLSASALSAQTNRADNKPQDSAYYKGSNIGRGWPGGVDQLLKKMKGFEIGDDGTVFHNGQQVNRAKINDKQYRGVDIAKVIKGLPADGVVSIVMVDDGLGESMNGGKPGNPQEILSIVMAPGQSAFAPGFAEGPALRLHGRRMYDDPYITRYGEPTYTDPRNPSDRYVDRAISNMQAISNSMFEVNEWGDQVPHFVIKEWPGPGNPKVKKDKSKNAAQTDKPAQP